MNTTSSDSRSIYAKFPHKRTLNTSTIPDKDTHKEVHTQELDIIAEFANGSYIALEKTDSDEYFMVVFHNKHVPEDYIPIYKDTYEAFLEVAKKKVTKTFLQPVAEEDTYITEVIKGLKVSPQINFLFGSDDVLKGVDQIAEALTEEPEISPNQKILTSIEEAIFILERQLHSRTLTTTSPFLILIGGGASSGKTMFARLFSEKIPFENTLIACDDYFKNLDELPAHMKEGSIQWDHPEALHLDLLHSQIGDLIDGKSISKPIYSYKHDKAIDVKTVHPSPIVIVEGFHVLGSYINLPSDLNIYVDSNVQDRFMRRMLRDLIRTERHPERLVNDFFHAVEPNHQKFIEHSKTNADYIITNKHNPKLYTKFLRK